MTGRTKCFGVGAFLAAVAACLPANAQLRCEWIRFTPDNKPEQWVELPRSEFYEVVASMHARAVSDLASAAVVPLTADGAKKFNDRYEPIPGKQPYLIRAAYGHAGTGAFVVLVRGNDVRVTHQSLGRTSVCEQSAVVVNLAFVPREVYVTISIAE